MWTVDHLIQSSLQYLFFVSENMLSSFRFPVKKPELLAQWVAAVRRDSFKPTASTCLCSDHFLKSDYEERPGANLPKLKPDAVPSVFSFPAHLQVSVGNYRSYNYVCSLLHTDNHIIFCNQPA